MKNCTLAILAGGMGSRMGARKDRLHIEGRPILLHLLERIAFDGPTLLVIARDQPPPLGRERFDFIVHDQLPNAGPLAGIAAALGATQTQRLLVCSVDMPNVGPPQCDELLAALDARPECMGILYRREMAGVEKIEPFPGIFRSTALPVIEKRLSKSRRSLHALLDEPGFMTIDTPVTWREEIWSNLNTLDELRRFGGHVL